MNGLQITGMKFTSPAPAKKVPIDPKSIKNTPIKTPIKKPIVSKNNSKTIKKQQPKVQNIKKIEEKPKQIQKVEQVKKEELKQQPKIQLTPPIEYTVLVRYNHYKQKFKCLDNILDFAIIDDKYAFSYVFKGNFVPILKKFPTKQQVQCIQEEYINEQGVKKTSFKWQVQQGTDYGLQIRQDEAQEAKRQRKVYKAPVQQKKCPCKKNVRVDLLTEDMKKLGITQLGSAAHKQLLQQRDLQDILFS